MKIASAICRMKYTNLFILYSYFLAVSITVCAQSGYKSVTLHEVVDVLSLESPEAHIEKFNYQNEILQFENYRKSFLPSVSFNLTPISLNRSLRLLQNPTDGSYSYVDDYSNNSSAGFSVRQKIGITGGELSVSGSLNYLYEFSNQRNTFSTTPFSIGYAQQLWGGGKLNRMERRVNYAKNDLAIKEYCFKLSNIQQQALSLFLAALLGRMEQDLSHRTMLNADTLLQLASIKFNNGRITEYDMKQIELQAINAELAYQKACQSYVEAQDRLAVFLGTDKMDVEIPNLDVPLSIDLHKVLFYVNRNNPFPKRQEIQMLEAEQNLYQTRLNSRFNGNISFNYGVNKYSNSFIGAYRNLNTQQSVVISLQIPIFQWGINRNRLRIAQNNYETSKIKHERLLREFDNEVYESINSYNYSVKLWQTAERAFHLSQENNTMLIRKFAMGKVSLYELITAQNEQKTAMQRYYSAIRDTYNCYYILRGMALYDFKRNVELEEILVKK